MKVVGDHGYEVTESVETAGCVRISYVLRPTVESYIRCQLALPVDCPWNGLAPEKVVSPLRGGGVLHVRPWTPILRDESLLTSRFK